MKIEMLDTYLAAFTAKIFKVPLTEKISWSLFFKFPLMVIFYKIAYVISFIFLQIFSVIWFWVVLILVALILSLLL